MTNSLFLFLVVGVLVGALAVAIWAYGPDAEVVSPQSGTSTSEPIDRRPDGGIDRDTGPTIDATAAGTSKRDITYCTNDGVKVKLDFYHAKTAGSTPLVVYVHGGGWRKGDKAQSQGLPYVNRLLDQGYSVASVNCRLSPEYPFPAPIIDVKCAVRYLRVNASQYEIDPDRIGAMGFSAGAHLTMLLGVANSKAGFDIGEYEGVSSHVRAVVEIAGPSEITETEFRRRHPDIVHETFRDSVEVMTKASPNSYVDETDPPFLIFHGASDKVVPVSQTHLFDSALTRVGVDHTTVIIPGGGHGLPKGRRGDRNDPEVNGYANQIVNFLDKYLR